MHKAAGAGGPYSRFLLKDFFPPETMFRWPLSEAGAELSIEGFMVAIFLAWMSSSRMRRRFSVSSQATCRLRRRCHKMQRSERSQRLFLIEEGFYPKIH